MQDSKGFIWISSDAGVTRYDGTNFKVFTTKDGLPDNVIFNCYEDYKGRIWFVSFTMQLSYYYKGKIYKYEHNQVIKENLKGAIIKTDFYVDNNDKVYIGLKKEGYLSISRDGIPKVFEPNSKCLYIKPIENYNFFYSFAVSTQGFKKQIDLLDSNDNVVVSSMNISGLHSIVSNNLKTKNGNLLLGAYDHIIKINPNGKNELIKLNVKARVLAIYEDFEGKIWVSLFEKGLKCYASDNFKKELFSLFPNKSISNFYMDKTRGLWVTTLEDGIFYSPSEQFLTYNRHNRTPLLHTTTINNYNDSLYAIGYKNGIFCLFHENGNILHFEKLNKIGTNDEVSGMLYLKKENELIIDHSFPALNFDLKSFQFKPTEQNIGKFKTGIQLNSGELLVGTVKHLFKIYENNEMRRYFKKGDKFIRISSLLEFDDKIYVGALDGLYLLKNDELIYLGDQNNIFKERVDALASLKDGTILVGTKGIGITVIAKDSIFTIDQNDGLASDMVKSIYVDDSQTIWAGTNKGLSKIELKDNHFENIFNYKEKHGLPSNNIFCVSGNSKSIWVGSNAGVTKFKPASLKINKTPPTLVITGFKVNKVDTAILDYYELPYYKNHVEINFQGLQYKTSGVINYRYKLSDIDEDWNYTNNNSVTFQTLPYGKHIFSVGVENEDGIWSLNKDIQIIINKPFWLTWWFVTLFIILIVMCTIIGVRARMTVIRNRIRKNNLLQQRLLESRMKTLRAQMNPHFTFNTMNSIQHYLLKNEKENALIYLSKFAKLIRLILENSDRYHISMQEELDMLKIYLDLEKLRFEEGFIYTINYDDDLNLNQIRIPSMLIQPYIENAIWHGLMPKNNGRGELKINFTRIDNNICCIVEDNGIGRKESQKLKTETTNQIKKKSYGMSISKERLNILNQFNKNNQLSVKVEDLYHEGIAKGTKVTIKLQELYNLNHES